MFMPDIPPTSELDVPDIEEGSEEDVGMLDIVMEDTPLLMAMFIEFMLDQVCCREGRWAILLGLSEILPSLPKETFWFYFLMVTHHNARVNGF